MQSGVASTTGSTPPFPGGDYEFVVQCQNFIDDCIFNLTLRRDVLTRIARLARGTSKQGSAVIRGHRRWNPRSGPEASLLALGFQLSGLARRPVFLDLGLRDILVLRAHHAEDGRRGVLAARDRT